MNDHLNLKPSVFLTICRIIATVLVLAIVGAALLGLFDIRTEAQKREDRKEELLAGDEAQVAVEAMKFAYLRCPDITPESISVLTTTSKNYVCVIGKDDSGDEVSVCYNVTAKEEISASEYNETFTSLRRYYNYIGKKINFVKTFLDEELQFICEEAGK